MSTFTNPDVIRVWIKRSKDASRPKRERDYAWRKALDLADGCEPLTPRGFGLTVRAKRPALIEYGRQWRSTQGNHIIEYRRIYRTRGPGKWQRFNVTGAEREAAMREMYRREREEREEVRQRKDQP